MKCRVLFITLFLLSLITLTSTALAASKPTVYFVADTTSGNSPLKVTFTSWTTGNPTSYYWTFIRNDGYKDSGWDSKHAVTATHTFIQPGTYSISCTVTNKYGSTSYKIPNYIVVYPKSIPKTMTLQFSGYPTSGTSPLTVTFNAYTTGSAIPNYWYVDFGDGYTDYGYSKSNYYAVSHTFTDPGIYTVKFNAYDYDDNVAAVKAISSYITVTQPVSAYFTYSKDYSNSRKYHFYDQSTGSIYNRVWNFGDGTYSYNFNNPVHTYSYPGWYYVVLYVNNYQSQYGEWIYVK